MRHFVEQVAVVVAQPHAAVKVAAGEFAREAADDVLAGARLVKRLLRVCKSRGDKQRRNQVPVLVDVQALRQLVHH